MAQAKAERSLTDIRSLDEALKRALDDSGRSTEAVAGEIGCTRAYLADAVNPNRQEILQFQARNIVTFCRATHSVLPLAWQADQLGYVLVPRELSGSARDIALETLDVAAEAGKLSAEVGAAYADGRLTEQRRADIREQAHRVQREAAEVVRATTTSPISLVSAPARSA